MEAPATAIAATELNALAEVRSLALGIRYFATAILILVGYVGVQSARSISSFGQIFQDMLQGKPLPWLTQVVLDYQVALLLLAFVLPLAGVIALLTIRRHALALGVAAGTVLLTVIQFLLIWPALFAPLLQIGSTMGAAQ